MANYNPNLAKINRNYTFEELAKVFSVHKNTVSSWVKDGLPCIKEGRPFLILGKDAKLYLQERRSRNKQKCKLEELFCVRCKAPTLPAEGLVEYTPLSDTKGMLTGFCGHCECTANKFISSNDLEMYSTLLDISKPKALKHINDSDNPPLNSDFKRRVKQ